MHIHAIELPSAGHCASESELLGFVRVSHAQNDNSAIATHQVVDHWPQPNSWQEPTRCRPLARRFRASFCATLRVAPPGCEGTARLSQRTLGRRKDAAAPI